MKGELMEGTQCEACGSWEFNCQDEQYFCVACQVPVPMDENEGKDAKTTGKQDATGSDR